LAVNRLKKPKANAVPSLVKGKLKRMIADRHLYLMLFPFLAYYAVFYFMPYSGLRMAFMNYKPLLGYAGSKWVGLANFRQFFGGIQFPRLMRNTVLLNLFGLIFGFPIPIILALMFNEIRNRFLRTAAQTIAYIPYFISTVVIAGLVVNFLSPSGGIVNSIIRIFGVEPIYFMAKPQYFRTIFVAQGIWSGAGFGSIVYYSSICSIDADMYEAARIDGAGRLKQTVYITVPGISRTVAIMFIIAIGNLLATNTDMIILLQRPATYETSDVIGSYVYRIGIGVNSQANFSLSTAVGLFNGIISLILVTGSNYISRRIGDVSIY
jgi:putative aldouronate transport system permease protein